VHGLAKAYSGSQQEAQRFCEEALSAASTAGDFGLQSRALLAAAEAALARKDGQKALALATEAQQRFARGGQLESEWRVWTILARANALLGNTAQSADQFRKASEVRGSLETQWGTEAFKLYSSRPDIQVYLQTTG
jgi:hypothetical protein